MKLTDFKVTASYSEGTIISLPKNGKSLKFPFAKFKENPLLILKTYPRLSHLTNIDEAGIDKLQAMTTKEVQDLQKKINAPTPKKAVTKKDK